MNAKLVFLLMLALGCGTLAAVAASQMMKAQQASAPQQKLTEILVANENLEHGAKVTKERFKLVKWPSERLPEGAVSVLKDVEGKFTNQPLYAGEPLLQRKIMDSMDFVATKIPPGYRVFDMSLGDSSTYINPGDRVDIFGYFQKSTTIAQTRSMKILQNVQVLMVDGVVVRSSENDSRKSAKTCQLLIKDSQYEALTTASNLGKLRLAMCGASASEITEGKADNGEEFLEWVDSSVGGSNGSPTAGAPTFPVAVSTTSEEEPEYEQQSMIVYSGGIARIPMESREIPAEVGGQKAKPAKSKVFTGAENVAPSGKLTRSGTFWDPTSQEWTETDLKSGASAADAKASTTDAQLP